MEGITKLVSQGMQNWNDKRKSGRHGAVSTKFHKFCGSVDSHKSLLKVLPESHEYFSLFMGSVTAVVKASVNHETIVESLAHALEDMTDLIQDSERDLLLFPNDEMTSRVVDLYTGIFRFLENSLEWMMRARHKRAADAFNENLAELLQKDIAEVKAKSQRIRLFATQSGLADGRMTRHRVEGIDRDVQHLREDNARLAATIEEMRDSQRELARLLQRNLLMPQAKAWADQQRLSAEAHQQRLSWQSASSMFSIEDENILDQASQALDGFFDRGRIKLLPEGFHVNSIPCHMIQHLINWLENEAEGSSIIWLQGPATLAEDHDNPMSMLAAKYIEIAGEIKLRDGKPMPLISYFCTISRQRPREGNPTREAQGVIALVYALLHQLVTELLSSPPADLPTQALFSRLEQHMSSLDGTIRTWDGALSALAEAAGFVPMGTLCVVDGLHWLDGRDIESLLCDLVRCLRKSGLKILFTTSARSGALLEVLTPEEHVEMNES
ncbi:hypothetical protein ACJ41O_007192 [Fusarium nematophilum]